MLSVVAPDVGTYSRSLSIFLFEAKYPFFQQKRIGKMWTMKKTVDLQTGKNIATGNSY